MTETDWIAQAEELWREGKHSRSISTVRNALVGEIAPHEYTRLARWIGSLQLVPELTSKRVAWLRTYTIDTYLPPLLAHCFASSILVDPVVEGFGQLEQTLDRQLFDPPPWAIILMARIEDLSPELTDRYLDLDSAARSHAITEIVARVASLVQRIRQSVNSAVLIPRFHLSRWPALGILDRNALGGQKEAIDELNLRLARELRAWPSVFFVDEEEWLRAATGKRFDPLLWSTSRVPHAWGAARQLARAHATFLRALAGHSRKCLIVDLDETLWGGIVGEDGVGGIHLEPEGNGLGYIELQKYIKSLARRGVVLAIASKNDPQIAMEVIETHPQMILRAADFAAVAINWDDKASNLRGLAAQLNLGLDSFVFIDDNPAECALIEQELPAVMTFASRSPYDTIEFLERERPFDTLSFSTEDVQRTALYRSATERDQLRTSQRSLEDFYRELQMKIVHEPLLPDHPRWERAVQLLNKTNQFNLTGERRHGSELVSTVAQGGEIHSFSVQDRFGDNGLIALAVVEPDRDSQRISSFVMSCRVIGRTIEDAIVALIAEAAHQNRFATLVGEFRRTSRNQIVETLYQRLGFDLLEQNGVSGRWSLRLPANLKVPEWFSVEKAMR